MADEQTENTEVENTEGAQSTAENDGQSGAENTPQPMSAEEATAVRAALKKANDEAKKYRLEAKALKEKDESDSDKSVREAVESATSGFRKVIVNAEAKAALAAADLTSAPDRFLKMISHAEVTVDEDGAVTGLDEQIAAIKKDFPEVFTARKNVAKADGAEKPPAKQAPKSTAERIASGLFGG